MSAARFQNQFTRLTAPEVGGMKGLVWPCPVAVYLNGFSLPV